MAHNISKYRKLLRTMTIIQLHQIFKFQKLKYKVARQNIKILQH